MGILTASFFNSKLKVSNVLCLTMGKGIFVWKKQSNPKHKKDIQYSLEFLPNELAVKIFDQVSQRDLLNCRLTCWAICMKIGYYYLSVRKFQLHDKWYNGMLQKQLSFSPTKTITVPVLKTEISLTVLRLNFAFVSELELTGMISQKNLSKLLLCAVNLKSLTLGCLVLGGTERLFSNKFLNCSPNQNEKTRREKLKCLFKSSKHHQIPIHDLRLNLNYFPCSKNKGFCNNIIENLNSIHHLHVPFLTSLEFSVGHSDFQEKYMFSISEIFGAIPKCCYDSLRKLTIIGPCLRYRHRNDQDMLQELLTMKLQLNYFALHYDSKSHELMSIPNIILSFIKTQTTLETVKIVCNGFNMLTGVSKRWLLT